MLGTLITKKFNFIKGVPSTVCTVYAYTAVYQCIPIVFLLMFSFYFQCEISDQTSRLVSIVRWISKSICKHSGVTERVRWVRSYHKSIFCLFCLIFTKLICLWINGARVSIYGPKPFCKTRFSGYLPSVVPY